MDKSAVDTLVDWIRESKKIIVLTGAELSAESGVPDFSDPRLNPNIRDFRSNRQVRADYWKKIKDIYPVLANAQPNDAHLALVELEILGQLDCIFTQTTDGLHHRAGSNSVMEIHSSMLWVNCTNCGKDYTTDNVLGLLDKGSDVPICEVCGADLLKPPISFPGQPPSHWETREAWMRLRDCDLFLIIGASLESHPASSFPAMAKEHGAKIAIISEKQSPADDYAEVVIYGMPSQVLPHVLKKLKEGIELT